MTELARASEQAVGRGSFAMMNAMRRTNATEEAEAREPSDGETTVHEAVVHDDVGDPEERHADADPAKDGAVDAVPHAADDDERCRDRGMRDREDVVRFEAAEAKLVMASMQSEEEAVPDASMEEPRPELHERRDDQRDDDRNDDLGHGRPR